MRLLVRHADEFRKLLLRQSKHDSPLADARSDMLIYRGG
jgi:hypothetical protein